MQGSDGTEQGVAPGGAEGPRPLVRLERRHVLVAFAVGLIFATLGLGGAMAGHEQAGNAAMAAGPFMWGLALGLLGTPARRRRSLFLVWFACAVLGAALMVLSTVGFDVMARTPFLVGVYLTFWAGLGTLFSVIGGGPGARRLLLGRDATDNRT